MTYVGLNHKLQDFFNVDEQYLSTSRDDLFSTHLKILNPNHEYFDVYASKILSNENVNT